jgi:hypothetical protein
MAQGSTVISFLISDSQNEALQKLAVKQNKSKSDLIRCMLQKGLAVDSYKEDVDFIREQINEELRHVLRPQIERLAKMIAKGGVTSAASLFLLAELMSSMVHESRRREFDEAVETAKKRGVVYFRLPDSELGEFLNKDGKLSESLW